jgi:hypothetical protein
MTQSKAKACPFCGSKADAVRWWDGSLDITAVRCSNRECLASFKSVDRDVWNTRATIPEADFPQLELLMRRFCMASPGEPRDLAKAAVLAFIANR